MTNHHQTYLFSKDPILKCVIFPSSEIQQQQRQIGPILVTSKPIPNLDQPCIKSLALIDVERLASKSSVSLSCSSATEELASATSTLERLGSSFTPIHDYLVEESILDCSIPIFVEEELTTMTETIGNSSLHNDNNNTKNNLENSIQKNPQKDIFDESINQLLFEIKNLRGIQERLHDASMAITNKNDNTDQTKDEIGLFSLRAENIVQEILSTLAQHRRQRNNKKNQYSSSSRKRSRDKMSNGNSSSSPSLPSCNRSIEYYNSLFEQCIEVETLLMQSSSTKNDVDDTNSLDMNEELTQVKIIYHDEESRPHELVMDLSEKFPSEAPLLTTDLPMEFTPKLKGELLTKGIQNISTNDIININTSKPTTSMITSIYHQFTARIRSLQSFWQEMDDIDSNCLILEPTLPARRSYIERRIALSETVSIQLMFDPEHPRSTPLSMRLSGASGEMLELRKLYQNYVMGGSSRRGAGDDDGTHQDDTNKKDTREHDKNSSILSSKDCFWNDQLSVRANLQECFNITLPSPATPDENSEDFVNECGICYSHHLCVEEEAGAELHQHTLTDSDAYPNISCPNKSCARKYHRSCLLEWFQSLPNAKVSFDRIHGSCMYCCEQISVKIGSRKL